MLLVSCHSCGIELSTPAVFFSSMPSAARNIVIEVCSFSSPVVSIGFLLLPVAAAPVRLLLSKHPLRFLLPPSASSHFSFRVLVVSSVALVTLTPLVSVYSMSLPACACDYCVTAPCSTFRHLGTSSFPVLATLSGRSLRLFVSPVLVLFFLLVCLLLLLACSICRLHLCVCLLCYCPPPPHSLLSPFSDSLPPQPRRSSCHSPP